MKKALALTAVTALVAAVAAPAAGEGTLKLELKNGRVTLEARDVPPSQILAEWARVGQTRIVNGERVPGGPITLQLVDVPEAKALDAVLRSVAGYLAAPRPVAVPDASMFDRILVLAKPRQAARAQVAVPQPAAAQRFRGQQVGVRQQVDDQDQVLTPEPAPGEVNPNMPPQPGYTTPGFPTPPDPGANPAMPPTQEMPATNVPGGMVPPGSSPIPGVIVQPPKPPVKPPGAPGGEPYRQ